MSLVQDAMLARLGVSTSPVWRTKRVWMPRWRRAGKSPESCASSELLGCHRLRDDSVDEKGRRGRGAPVPAGLPGGNNAHRRGFTSSSRSVEHWVSGGASSRFRSPRPRPLPGGSWPMRSGSSICPSWPQGTGSISSSRTLAPQNRRLRLFRPGVRVMRRGMRDWLARRSARSEALVACHPQDVSTSRSLLLSNASRSERQTARMLQGFHAASPLANSKRGSADSDSGRLLRTWPSRSAGSDARGNEVCCCCCCCCCC